MDEVKASRRGNTVGSNRDRLTVGVDLGDRWSQYCILALEGETLAEGQLRTTLEDVGFLTALKDGKDWGLAHRARQLFPVLTGSYRRKGTVPGQRAAADSCVCGKLQSGPTKRPPPRIKSRLNTAQSRHPTQLRHGNQTASATTGVHSHDHAIIHSCSSPTASGSVLESTLARAVSRGRRSRPPDRRRGRSLA